MSIKIAERLRPFSHVPGVSCSLPKSRAVVRVFPTRLCIEGIADIELEVCGPVRKFTVEQDLERGQICVHGESASGYIRYFIAQEEKGIAVRFDKFPIPKETLLIPYPIGIIKESKERLSLGMHKAQDFEMIRRRSDLKEIFPLWLKLAHLLPEIPPSDSYTGTLQLLEQCEQEIAHKKRETVYDAFLKLFHVGFYDMLVPRLSDTQFQGIVTSNASTDLSPQVLLQQGGALIRSLFFQESQDSLSMLPCLPKEFHAGRYLNLETSHGDEIDLEWAKKMVQKMIIRPKSTRIIHLNLPKSIKSYRLRTSLQDRGRSMDIDSALPFDPRVVPCLILDRFQK